MDAQSAPAFITCLDWQGNSHTVPLSEVVARESAYALIVRDGKILLAHGSYGDAYSFLGGGMNDGETVEECVRREVLEEAGLEVALEKELEPYRMYWWHEGREVALDCTFHFRVCGITGGELLGSHRNDRDWEDEKPEWVPVDALDERKMRGFNAPILRELKRRGELR